LRLDLVGGYDEGMRPIEIDNGYLLVPVPFTSADTVSLPLPFVYVVAVVAAAFVAVVTMAALSSRRKEKH
jgi:hypothetical protein